MGDHKQGEPIVVEIGESLTMVGDCDRRVWVFHGELRPDEIPAMIRRLGALYAGWAHVRKTRGKEV